MPIVAAAAGLRNLIAHQYAVLDFERLYGVEPCRSTCGFDAGLTLDVVMANLRPPNVPLHKARKVARKVKRPGRRRRKTQASTGT